MKTPLLLLTLALAVPPAAADTTPPAPPPYTVPRSQVRVLPRSLPDRQYQLYIGLPARYGQDPAKRYPVVYVTDGYWDFIKFAAIAEALAYDKVVPDFIIVGLGYAGEGLDYGRLRNWDLAPVPFGDQPEKSGHAADFLQLLEREVIPLIERDYRADPAHRVLAGASLGGLFTLYAMYTKPDLFEAYIAATPAVVLGNDWLLGYEEAFAKAGRVLRGRLYVAGGGNESPGFLGGILRYNSRVASRRYADLAYEFRIIDGERHAGMQLETYVRGVRFALAPLAPERGPATAP